MTPLEELGRRVGRTQDQQLEQLDVGRTKERLLAAAPAPPRRARLAVVLAAALALAALVWLVFPSPELGFELSSGQRVQVGQWIGAPANTPLEIRFLDGTTVALAPKAAARVAAIDESGARVVVERGRVHVSVTPRPGARWSFDVGPFGVLVTGTRFVASWDPDTTELSLRLDEGSVLVSGPIVGEARPVTAGQTLQISVAAARLELSVAPGSEAPEAPRLAATDRAEEGAPEEGASAVQPAPPGRAGEERSDSPSPGLQGEAPEPSASALASSTAEAEADPALSWQQLARAGSYREALERAETQGFDSLLAAASAEELRTLADAARLAGSPERARQALVELRRRFPTAEGAALAAFLLGRAAFDEDKAYGAAAGWFSIYLAEAPAGPFAREAAGRLLEARSLAGDERGARAAARAYLAAYPDGPHAARARNLLLIP